MSLVTKLVWVDVLFTENPSDLNVYLDGGLTGCCEAISVPTDIGDLNELASEYRATNVSFDLISPPPSKESYQIYATKSGSSTAANSAPKSALKDWWDAYPASVSFVGSLKCAEVADLIRNPKLGEKDVVVVDVRRNDHAVGVLSIILRFLPS